MEKVYAIIREIVKAEVGADEIVVTQDASGLTELRWPSGSQVMTLSDGW
jgi:hypothetical protein